MCQERLRIPCFHSGAMMAIFTAGLCERVEAVYRSAWPIELLGRSMKLELLTNDEAGRRSEYRKRRSAYIEETIPGSRLEEYELDGWSISRTNKSGSHRVRKQKPIDQMLEDECWCILYQIGYKTLNLGRNFKIPLTKSNGAPAKQIDVFAYDDSSIVIFECKTSLKRSKRQMGPAVHEFAGLRKQISDTLRLHFDGDFKQKLIWAFVTKNIVWSPKDLQRAAAANIHVIRDTEVAYFSEISRRIGEAAKYQFQAEFLKTSKALQGVKVFALRTSLAGETAYSFFAPAKKILPLSFVNHRDLRDPEASPSYQRMVQRSRLAKIGEYLNAGGFFPNSIIVNFHGETKFDILKPADEDGIAAGVLTLPENYKSIMIIDGQHRLYGYTQIEDGKAPDLQFLAFDGITIQDETRLFSDINFEQKTVSRKLLDEIAGEIKLDSENPLEKMRAISSRAFDLMRSDMAGPFGDKIAGADMAGAGKGDLTLPSLNNAVKESRILGSARKKGGEFEFVQGPVAWSTPTDAIDKLFRLMSSYFSLFWVASPERWDAGKEGVFARNIGVAGLIQLLSDLIYHQQKSTDEDPRLKEPEELVDDIRPIVAPLLTYYAEADLGELQNRFKTQFGTQGPKEFQRKARFLIHEANPDFLPPGLGLQLKEFSAARTDAGDKLSRLLQQRVLSQVTERLKKHYGDSSDYLVDAGLPADDYGELAKRQQEHRKKYNEKLPLETFIDFIKWKQIVQKPDNWPLVKDVVAFNLEAKGNPNRKELTSWFDKMNDIRRIPAHPFGRERYSDDEIDVLKFLYKELRSRGLITEVIDVDAIS